MKSILISIKPEWVAKILNGEKTIEIRKTAPKCELPVEVYIYCTKGGLPLEYIEGHGFSLSIYNPQSYKPKDLRGKVVAKFTLNKLDEILNCGSIDETDTMYTKYFCGYKKSGITHETIGETRLLEDSNLLYRELNEYLHGRKGYAWHISNLEVLDYPLFVDEFSTKIEHKSCDKCNEHCRFYYDSNTMSGKPNTGCTRYYRLLKVPQSWQYIEVQE